MISYQMEKNGQKSGQCRPNNPKKKERKGWMRLKIKENVNKETNP